jgi:AcrR family transcriptional regulator
MSRPVNDARPAELLDAVVRYLVQHGLSRLSLRPLAKAVGSSPRVLLYYFESSEQLIAKALARLRGLQRAELIARYVSIAGAPAAGYFAIWKAMTAPASEPLFRLFFEVYGLAVRQPRRFKPFLTSTVNDWLDAIDDAESRKRLGRRRSRALATIVVAGFRGFMIDYLASRDRTRIDGAVRLWLRTLGELS